VQVPDLAGPAEAELQQNNGAVLLDDERFDQIRQGPRFSAEVTVDGSRRVTDPCLAIVKDLASVLGGSVAAEAMPRA
jgi:hypothetical protein